jgi:hypothetical protein
MKSIAHTLVVAAVALLLFVVAGRAQQRTDAPASTDPRVGLKAGLRDAGEAARNMDRIATVPKPQGFFDPNAPGGPPTPPERPEDD